MASAARPSFAVSLVPTLRRYPVGALFGLVATAVVSLLADVFPARVWLELPITLICVPGCMLIERLIDWRFSGVVDARMRHSAAHEDARIALDKLKNYESQGIINKPDAHKKGAAIAKRDVDGGPRLSKPRGSYKRRGPAASPPAVAAAITPDTPVGKPDSLRS